MRSLYLNLNIFHTEQNDVCTFESNFNLLPKVDNKLSITKKVYNRGLATLLKGVGRLFTCCKWNYLKKLKTVVKRL